MIPISTPSVNKIQETKKQLSIKDQFTFFAPLAATTFLITITHSLFNAGLARLPSPEIYISAFAVARSVMSLFQSPTVMLRETFSTLVNDRDSFLKVSKFMSVIMALVIAFFAFIAFSKIGQWIFSSVMNLEGKTLVEAVKIFQVFILLPLASAFRNFTQGILIKFRLTPLVTVGTAVRILYVIVFVSAIEHLTMIPNAVLAGLMFLGAMIIEAAVLLLGAKIKIGNIAKKLDQLDFKITTTDYQELSYNNIFRFYYPLVITSLFKTVAVPIINIGLARTINPELAISAYAVGWALGMIFLSPLVMFQQMPINFFDENDKSSINSVRKFAIYIASFITLALFLLSFTNIGVYVLRTFIGASEQITILALDVLKIMCILPAIMIAREFYWGILIKKRLTKYLGRGKAINIVALISSIAITSFIGPANPAVIGIVGMVSCEAAEFFYLFLVAKKHKITG